MKKIINLKDSYKMIIIYLISTIISGVMAGLVVKIDYIKFYLRNYLWVLIIFTIVFLTLIRVFKVKFKGVLIFLGIIMVLLVFLLLNADFLISPGTTPDDGIFPFMGLIGFYTTLPFQSVIHTLVGYDLGKLSYIAVPIYMLLLSILSYCTLKFKSKN